VEMANPVGGNCQGLYLTRKLPKFDGSDRFDKAGAAPVRLLADVLCSVVVVADAHPCFFLFLCPGAMVRTNPTRFE
jgi:hypothetical protein